MNILMAGVILQDGFLSDGGGIRKVTCRRRG
jgi:hypothetical protein